MITYKITSVTDLDSTKITSVEFDYNGPRTVEVAHFRPSSMMDIEVGIMNRINSEIASIDAAVVSAGIVVDTNVEKTAPVLAEVVGTNPYSDFTDDELSVKLGLLSAEYDTIQARIDAAGEELAANSAEYDLIIDELIKRG